MYLKATKPLTIQCYLKHHHHLPLAKSCSTFEFSSKVASSEPPCPPCPVSCQSAALASSVHSKIAITLHHNSRSYLQGTAPPPQQGLAHTGWQMPKEGALGLTYF